MKIIILVVVFISCNESTRLIKEENKIKDFLISQKSNSFNVVLDTISTFKWDELLIVSPYTDLDRISEYDLNSIPN